MTPTSTACRPFSSREKGRSEQCLGTYAKTIAARRRARGASSSRPTARSRAVTRAANTLRASRRRCTPTPIASTDMAIHVEVRPDFSAFRTPTADDIAETVGCDLATAAALLEHYTVLPR